MKPSELAELLMRQLDLREAERAVASVLACDGELTHASLILGPPRMAASCWPEWGAAQEADVPVNCTGLPSTFVLRQDRWTAARLNLTQRAAQWWLAGALAGRTPAIGGCPESATHPGEPHPVLLARAHNKSPASGFAAMAGRPVHGAFVPLAPGDLPAAPLEWPLGSAPHWLLTVLGIDAPASPAPSGRLVPFAPPGILVGRLSRRAWIGHVRFRPAEGLQIELRREANSDPDLHGLVLELTEGDGGELFDSRRLALADVRIPARATTRIWLRMPTLGQRIERSLRLYDRAGELLDQRDPFNFVERISLALTVNGSAAPPVVVGDQSNPPTLPERLQALHDAEAEWEWWRGHGLRYRVVTDRRAMRLHLRRRLQRARGEILVIDPYFGTKDAADWAVVEGLRATVRVLMGNQCFVKRRPSRV